MTVLSAGMLAACAVPGAQVDRLEGAKAVLVLLGGETVIVDRSELPPGTAEGDTLGPGWRERRPEARARTGRDVARRRARLGSGDDGRAVKLQ
jgi:hypothetical protein